MNFVFRQKALKDLNLRLSKVKESNLSSWPNLDETAESSSATATSSAAVTEMGQKVARSSHDEQSKLIKATEQPPSQPHAVSSTITLTDSKKDVSVTEATEKEV